MERAGVLRKRGFFAEYCHPSGDWGFWDLGLEMW